MPNRIKHQAIPLYTPSETLFNDKNSICEWHEDYSPKVICDDQSQIVIDSPTFLDNIGPDSGFDFNVNGNVDFTVLSNVVVDAASTFITDGIVPGMYLMLYTAGVNSLTAASGKVVTVDSETQLTLDSSLNQTGGDYFEVSPWEYIGDIRTVNGAAEFGNTLPSATASRLVAPIEDNIFYKVEFTITFTDPDLSTDYLIVTLGNTNILQIFNDDIEAKTYIAYGISDGTELTIEVDGGSELTIDNFILSETYSTSYDIKNCETDSIEYSSALSDFIYSVYTSQMQLNIDWSNVCTGYITSGCFYIDVAQVTNPKAILERITGTLTSPTQWTYIGAGVVVGGGFATFTNVDLDNGVKQYGDQLAYQFNNGIDYTINFDIGSYVAGDLDVILLYNGVEVVNLGTFSAGGSVSIDTGILASNCNEIRFIVSTATKTSLTLANISAIQNTVSTQYEYRTNCFELTEDLTCMVKLSGANLDNAFGIDFVGLPYHPFIRVDGEINPASFGGKKINEEDSAGESTTLYFKSEESGSLFLYSLPMFHHEFIRLLIGYDTFAIDDVEYIAEEDGYTPEFDRVLGKNRDTGNSSTEVRKKNDLNVNKLC